MIPCSRASTSCWLNRYAWQAVCMPPGKGDSTGAVRSPAAWPGSAGAVSCLSLCRSWRPSMRCSPQIRTPWRTRARTRWSPRRPRSICGRRAAFLALWLLTLILGALFLYGTAQEWHRLIYERGLTISTNLFGTTYYSLVALHGFHVTAGLIMLTAVLLFGLAGRVGPEQSARIDVLSLYWHFVDAVWVVVFTVVYV